MFKHIFRPALAALLISEPLAVCAQVEHRLPAVGTYAAVDTRRTLAALKALAGTPARQRAAIAQVGAAPGAYAPPVLCALSAVLLRSGHTQDACFWFYAGQLRAGYDARISTDPTAGDADAVLTDSYGPPVNWYAFHHLPFLEALIPRVIAWDRRTPHDYDPRWIALSGMGAVRAGLGGAAPQSLTLPPSQWPAVAERRRQSYLAGFRDAFREAKHHQAGQGVGHGG